MNEFDLAWELARGNYRPPPGEITPHLLGPEHAADYARVSRLVKSVGPRALAIKTAAAVGDVNWGAATTASDARQDDALRRLNLPDLARKLAESWNVDGIIALHAYHDRDTKQPKLARLTGYLEPYHNPRNMDELEGLYQAKRYLTRSGKKRWWVRIYDWTGGAKKANVREWHDLPDPLQLARAPSRSVDGAEIPAVRIYATTDDGLVTSRFLTGIPLMLSIMATELSLERARELAAWPIPVFKNAGEVSIIGPAAPVQVFEDGDFYFAEPGNLTELREHLRDRTARWASDMNLPAGLIHGNRSGQSIREENINFYTEARSDAHVLTSILTEALERYATLTGQLEPVPVSVNPNLEYMRETVLSSIFGLVDRNLLPTHVAMREVQSFFGSYSDTELHRAIERQGSGDGGQERGQEQGQEQGKEHL